MPNDRKPNDRKPNDRKPNDRKPIRFARRAVSVFALSAAVSGAGLFGVAGNAFATPAAGAALGVVRGADQADTIKDHYIVVLKDAAASAGAVNTDAAQLTGKVGGAVHSEYTSAVKGFSATLSDTAARRLAVDPSVAYVEQDRQVHVAATQVDPPSWGLDRIDQANLPLDRSYTAGSAASVHAYIIDTGIRMTQTEFAGRVSSGYDFVDNDSDASDCFGHGTHVAGTVGGATHGVAKDVQLVAVRVLDCTGSGSYSQIIAGVDWVTAHAVKPAVANMSLGGTAGNALDDAVQKSIDSGVTYAVAGGNDSGDACLKSPARLPGAITVGATDSTDRQASFSNYGHCLDLYAPGVNILSSSNASDTATERMSGTSMATPHVTGAAALYLQTHPTATAQQVRDALVNAATTGTVTGAPASSPNKLLNIIGLQHTATVTPVTPTPAAACGSFTNHYPRTISGNATVDSKITTIGCTGNASATSTVKVSITDSNRGDLRLDLIAPNGTAYTLKAANPADKVPNLDTTYTLDASSAGRAGTWHLRVTDTAAHRSGTLTTWTLTI